MMPEALAPMHVRDVHLEDWKVAGVQRVEDRDGSMGEGSGVDDDPTRLLARCVNPIDDLIFAVALVEADFEFQLLRQGPAVALDTRERLMAVDMRLALAQKVQVRSVQDEDDAAHGGCPSMGFL
jgi:hypothetical protein